MSHYFDRNAASSKKENEWSVTVKGQHFTFVTGSGMFSLDHIDTASLLLATESEIPDGARVLDLGSGYGAVGIIVATLRSGVSITMVDTNVGALRCAEKNCKRNGVSARVLESDGTSKIKDEVFDVVLVNPPFAAGKEVWQRMIVEGFAALAPNGTLQAVARTSKGGGSVEQQITELAGKCEVIARGSGFRVYVGRKK